MENKRYGIIVGASVQWGMFFTKESAEKYLPNAKKDYSDARIVEFKLINDEGCSPYLVPLTKM